MIGLKILFAENVFDRLKEEADKRKTSVTNCAYTLIKEKLNVTREEE